MRYLTDEQRRIHLYGEFPPSLDPREEMHRHEQEAEGCEEDAEVARAHLEELHEAEMEAEYEREQELRDLEAEERRVEVERVDQRLEELLE